MVTLKWGWNPVRNYPSSLTTKSASSGLCGCVFCQFWLTIASSWQHVSKTTQQMSTQSDSYIVKSGLVSGNCDISFFQQSTAPWSEWEKHKQNTNKDCPHKGML